MTRGLDNNNPGNIRSAPNSTWWLGQTGVDKWGMAIFDTMVNGVRALAKLLMLYQQKHNLNTIRQIISRWAPPNENDTDAYANDVAQRTGIDADSPIELTDGDTLDKLVRAIIWHENAQFPPDADMETGVAKALQ